MLVTKAALREGEWVLIWGIGGGVALAAFELCRALGARTIVTSSSAEKLELARGLGADVAVSHVEDDVVAVVKEATDGAGADVVVETVGEATWERSLAAAAREGRIVVCGATTGHSPPARLYRLWWKQLTVYGSTMGMPVRLRGRIRAHQGGTSARSPRRQRVPAGRRRQGARAPRVRRAVREGRPSDPRLGVKTGGTAKPTQRPRLEVHGSFARLENPQLAGFRALTARISRSRG